VLEAARELFGREGLECQVEEVARAAGVGVGTVYRHFPNKEALVDALIEYRFERLSERAAEALEEEDAWEAFCGLLRWAAEYQAQDRALSNQISQRPMTARQSAIKSGLHERTGELIRRAQRSGQLRKDVVVEDVPTMMCALGAATGSHEESVVALNWERLLALILDGMRAPGGSRLPKPRTPG
jgi:AcrR family transcriptional regulator